MSKNRLLSTPALLGALCLALAPSFLCCDPSLAALKAKGQINVEETRNPHPESFDIVLPMPMDMAMSFVAVAVPSEGFLWDVALRPGTGTSQKDRVFYDRRYSAALSAPFTSSDLPRSWASKVAKGKYSYYFMAKYEVTRRQWRAVMDESPDPALAPDDALPVTGISWFDALKFTERYTAWLLANHPDCLPKFAGDDKNVGFLRLPTELEWEYAARGGAGEIKAMKANDFFPLGDDLRLQDYAVYQIQGTSHSASDLQKVGSKRPNPIGLYDTAGNAAEMTMDSFRFSVGGRLHGSAGGFVRKGGSFLSSEEEIMPGRREEVPFFIKDGPGKARDLGFRPVISGINTPGGGRLESLMGEYQRIGNELGEKEEKADQEAAKTPMEELDRLIKDNSNAGIRQNLEALKATLQEVNFRREREKELIAESQLQYCIMVVETARDYIMRLAQIKRIMQEAKGDAAATPKAKAAAKTIDQGLVSCITSYLSTLDDFMQTRTDLAKRATEKFFGEYSGSSFFDRRMSQNLKEIVVKHYNRRKQGKNVSVAEARRDLEALRTQKIGER